MEELQTYRIRHKDTSGYMNWWEGQAYTSKEAVNMARYERPEFRKPGELYIRVKTFTGCGGWKKPTD